MTSTIRLPLRAFQAGFHRFTVDEYEELIRDGHITEDDDLELIEGYLVQKMSRNPPHDASLQLLPEALARVLPAGWRLRVQSAARMLDSVPEPDGAVVRGDARTYATRHPGPADTAFVVEVADSTLDSDRADKQRIYARAGVGEFWIVNIPDRQVEVYTLPSGPAADPAYGTRTDYPAGAAVPVTLDGTVVGSVPVDDLLP